MKSVRNLFVLPLTLIGTGIAVFILLLAAFAQWQNSGFAVALCYVIGAVGVIWLAWNWLMLRTAIISTARLLNNQSPSNIKPAKSKIINELKDVIEKHNENNTNYITNLVKQIRDLQIQIQLSKRQKRNIEEIIYSIRDAVIVVDQFDKLLMANEAAGKLFNFDYKNSRHKPISELICSDKTNAGKSEFVDFLTQSRQSKARATKREIKITVGKKQITVDKKSNKKQNTTTALERTYDCIISCVYDENQQLPTDNKEKEHQTSNPTDGESTQCRQVCGVVAVLHDITREKEISQMKNDFVSHVSHELKTPLSSINAYSEMLLDGEADDEKTRKEFYEVIQSQAKRLNRLIEDILNTSRIESGLIKVDKKPLSLTMLIEEQLQMMKKYAQEKNISISWGQAEQKPIVFDQVYMDKDMISQVIINLLSNAVKYTKPGGSIKIETQVDEIESLARVSVTDTGVGISEDEIEHVFDKFYRVVQTKIWQKVQGWDSTLLNK